MAILRNAILKQKRFDVTDYIRDDPDRFAAWAVNENPGFTNFKEFMNAFDKSFKTSNGERFLNQIKRAGSLEPYKIMFQTKTANNQLVINVGQEESDKINRELNIRGVTFKESTQIPLGFKPTTLRVRRQGKYYVKRQNEPYSKSQILFIRERKAIGYKPEKVFRQYNAHFPKGQKRTYKSIKSKYYRIKPIRTRKEALEA